MSITDSPINCTLKVSGFHQSVKKVLEKELGQYVMNQIQPAYTTVQQLLGNCWKITKPLLKYCRKAQLLECIWSSSSEWFKQICIQAANKATEEYTLCFIKKHSLRFFVVSQPIVAQ